MANIVFDISSVESKGRFREAVSDMLDLTETVTEKFLDKTREKALVLELAASDYHRIMLELIHQRGGMGYACAAGKDGAPALACISCKEVIQEVPWLCPSCGSPMIENESMRLEKVKASGELEKFVSDRIVEWSRNGLLFFKKDMEKRIGRLPDIDLIEIFEQALRRYLQENEDMEKERLVKEQAAKKQAELLRREKATNEREIREQREKERVTTEARQAKEQAEREWAERAKREQEQKGRESRIKSARETMVLPGSGKTLTDLTERYSPQEIQNSPTLQWLLGGGSKKHSTYSQSISNSKPFQGQFVGLQCGDVSFTNDEIEKSPTLKWLEQQKYKKA